MNKPMARLTADTIADDQIWQLVRSSKEGSEIEKVAKYALDKRTAPEFRMNLRKRCADIINRSRDGKAL